MQYVNWLIISTTYNELTKIGDTHEKDDTIDIIFNSVFRAFSSSIRRKILKHLYYREISRKELSILIGTSKENIIKHCDILIGCGLVTSEIRTYADNITDIRYNTFYRLKNRKIFELLEKVEKDIEETFLKYK